jgi:hypothetical protein
VTYTAEAYFGGLDRVFIYRHDAGTDTCVRLTLVSPVDLMNDFDIPLPMQWSIEGVNVHDDVDCMAQPIGSGTAGSGIIDFIQLDMLNYFPCELDIAAQFDLDVDPFSVDFLVQGLLVANTDC